MIFDVPSNLTHSMKSHVLNVAADVLKLFLNKVNFFGAFERGSTNHLKFFFLHTGFISPELKS